MRTKAPKTVRPVEQPVDSETVERDEVASPAIAEAMPETDHEAHPTLAGVTLTEVTLPLSLEIESRPPHHVALALYDNESRVGLARLRSGLERLGVKSAKTGRPIESHADAIRYLLAQLGQD